MDETRGHAGLVMHASVTSVLPADAMSGHGRFLVRTVPLEATAT
jgi:hypothetical protein